MKHAKWHGRPTRPAHVLTGETPVQRFNPRGRICRDQKSLQKSFGLNSKSLKLLREKFHA